LKGLKEVEGVEGVEELKFLILENEEEKNR
jgi:hypothetical protein